MDVNLAALILDESGASLVEYGVIIALIAVAVIAAGRTLGTSVNALYNSAGVATRTPQHY